MVHYTTGETTASLWQAGTITVSCYLISDHVQRTALLPFEVLAAAEEGFPLHSFSTETSPGQLVGTSASLLSELSCAYLSLLLNGHLNSSFSICATAIF